MAVHVQSVAETKSSERFSLFLIPQFFFSELKCPSPTPSHTVLNSFCGGTQVTELEPPSIPSASLLYPPEH